jgi:ketosteroid isomerase-like protein
MDSAAIATDAASMSARNPEDPPGLLVAAVASGDLDGFVAAYEDDAAMVVPPDGRVARGKAEIRRATEPMLAAGSSMRIDVIEKLESDGLALLRTRWAFAGMEGGAIVVTRRQPDGGWLIALDDPLGAG